MLDNLTDDRLMFTFSAAPMNGSNPLAFFITWTVYGTFLQGDNRGWRKRRKGEQPPQPILVQWRCERLKHPVELLTDAQRDAVRAEVARLCEYRSWHLWCHDARTNHVHVVVSSADYSGAVVRDQLKANCTRVLRQSWQVFGERPVWTKGGDWQCINKEDQLEQVVQYVSEAQDRKGLELG